MRHMAGQQLSWFTLRGPPPPLKPGNAMGGMGTTQTVESGILGAEAERLVELSSAGLHNKALSPKSNRLDSMGPIPGITPSLVHL